MLAVSCGAAISTEHHLVAAGERGREKAGSLLDCLSKAREAPEDLEMFIEAAL
jgi:hypothetical protein